MADKVERRPVDGSTTRADRMKNHRRDDPELTDVDGCGAGPRDARPSMSQAHPQRQSDQTRYHTTPGELERSSEARRDAAQRSDLLARKPRDNVSLSVNSQLVPQKRKSTHTHQTATDAEKEYRRLRRQRLASLTAPAASALGKPPTAPASPCIAMFRQEGGFHNNHGIPHANHTAHSNALAQATPRHRSNSPPRNPPRHRRSLSTHNLVSPPAMAAVKNKRQPPPLRTTITSDSDEVPRLLPRTTTTPHPTDSTMSPAKLIHKKHLDAHGQTPFAKACGKGELELARTRLQERPEDLNVADYAGNTPLQAAALQGHADVVQFLLEAGCDIHCQNNEKETPLLDAVDNGHLEVVKLLLNAGVDPRRANLKGEEPLARVTNEMTHARELREALEYVRNHPPTSGVKHIEEWQGHDRKAQESNHSDKRQKDYDLATALNPRGLQGAATHRRAATASRAAKTSNAQLHKPLNMKSLRDAALRGDSETVARILSIGEGVNQAISNDPEILIGAARGGHEDCMQLLLALGPFEPDPPPVPSLPYLASTPMLAAIGRGHLAVVRLLLEQNKFDPLRKIQGKTYFELARERAGPHWQEEEKMLQTAYDRAFERAGGKKEAENCSFGRQRSKEQYATASPQTRAPLGSQSQGLTHYSAKSKHLSSASARPSNPDAKRAHPFAEGDFTMAKMASTRPVKTNATSAAIADGEAAQMSPKTTQYADDRPISQHSEALMAAKPRRKLVSGRELKNERERQRRAITGPRISSKDHLSPPCESADKPVTEKYHDRARAIRAESMDSTTKPQPDAPPKRPRLSINVATSQLEGHEVTAGKEHYVKRRRIDSDNAKERRHPSRTSSYSSCCSSSDSRPVRPTMLAEASHSIPGKLGLGNDQTLSKRDGAGFVKSSNDASLTPKSAQRPSVDIISPTVKIEPGTSQEIRSVSTKTSCKNPDMSDASSTPGNVHGPVVENEPETAECNTSKDSPTPCLDKLDSLRRCLADPDSELQHPSNTKAEGEKSQRDAYRQLDNEQDMTESQRCQKAENARLCDDKRQAEETRLKEEARRSEQEAELKRQAVEEAKRLDAERALEAVEIQRLELQRLQDELAREKQKIRELEEQRLAKLPPLLRWFESCASPKQASIAQRFSNLHGYRYETITTQLLPTDSEERRRELWVINTHVAFLLGEKDLSLSSYADWPRLEASLIAKRSLINVECGFYALTRPCVADLATPHEDPLHTFRNSGLQDRLKAQNDAYRQLVAMDLFFVRLSDFLSAVARSPHLKDVRISVQYREAPLDLGMLERGEVPNLWQHDRLLANVNHGSVPGPVYYINGICVDQARSYGDIRTTSLNGDPEERRQSDNSVVSTAEDVTLKDPPHGNVCPKLDELDVSPAVSAYQPQVQLPSDASHGRTSAVTES